MNGMSFDFMKTFWALANLLSESANDKQRLAGAQVKKPRLFFIPHEKKARCAEVFGEMNRVRFNTLWVK